MDLDKPSGSNRVAVAAAPEARARLKRDLDDFVELMNRRAFVGRDPEEPPAEDPAAGGNDNRRRYAGRPPTSF